MTDLTDAEGRVLVTLLERSEQSRSGRKCALDLPVGSIGRMLHGVVPQGSRAGSALEKKGMVTSMKAGSGSWLTTYYGLTDEGVTAARAFQERGR